MEDSHYTPGKGTGPKYHLLMELGKGGMGIVHLAMARGPQGFTKLLVLKVMRRELLGDDDLHRMFMEEARISARLAHPNIVHVYEVGEHDGCPCLVMEYLEGQPLSSVLTRAPEKMPLALQLHVLAKALAGLHAAHELRDYDGTSLQLVHRDVSPHNIFVLFDGQVKVLDFGIAKAAGSEVETRTGSVKGKIRYMSPEQAVRDPMDRRADVFSVGVMLWEALAGRRMWVDLEEGEITRRLLRRQIPALPDTVAIPENLRGICARALALDVEDRYPTAEAFQRELERHLQNQAGPCGPDELGGFVRAQFGDLRETTKKVIDFHIKEVRQQTGAGAGHTPSGAARVRTATGAGSRSGAGTTHGRALYASEAGAEDAPTRAGLPEALAARARRSWWRVAVGGAAAGVLVFVLAGTGALRGATTRADVKGGEPRAGAGAPRPLDDDPVAACGAGLKRCGGDCVSIDRPDFGCGGDSCQSCGVSNATARCNQRHECDTAICYQSFADCDGDSHNGCETDLRIDPDHCGACGRKCPPLPHAERGCGDACTIWRCAAGFHDCNGAAGDGCEVSTASDAANCGSCGTACPAGQKCHRGECAP